MSFFFETNSDEINRVEKRASKMCFEHGVIYIRQEMGLSLHAARIWMKHICDERENCVADLSRST